MIIKRRQLGSGGIQGLQTPQSSKSASCLAPSAAQKFTLQRKPLVRAPLKPHERISEDPGEQSNFVILEVHFKGNYKLMTCERAWSLPEMLAKVAAELLIPNEEQDLFDPCSLVLFLLQEGQ